MKNNKNKNHYTGLGLTIGTGFATTIAVLIYVLTNNPVYFGLIGLGTAMGLVLGSALDANKAKKEDGKKDHYDN